MNFCVLSSGSRANCTFLEAAGKRILIDCGLSARQTVMRLRYMEIDPASLDAILLTHEHSDHIYGVSVMSRRFSLPVYANRQTAKHLQQVHAINYFETGRTFELDRLQVRSISIDHDADDPVAFTFEADGVRLAHVTDLGQVTPPVRKAVVGSHALVIEANHDNDLLRTCGYPWYLVERISGTHGHLSNDSAAKLVSEVMNGELRHLVLGHLSENSNTPDLALETLYSYIEASPQRTIACASARKPTVMYEL